MSGADSPVHCVVANDDDRDVLFVGLAILLMMAISSIPISRSAALLDIAAAILPFGPFIYDRWLVQQVGNKN